MASLSSSLRLARASLRSSRKSSSSLAASAPARAALLHVSAPARATSATGKDPQLGDYPDLPPVSLQNRKWSPRWWDQQDKRNFGETLHEQDDVLNVWAPDVHSTPAPVALRQFLVAASCFALFGFVIYNTQPGRPALPRTYPRGGLAAELGNQEVAALAEGAFDGEGEEEEEEEEE